jgi:hypothetical protein
MSPKSPAARVCFAATAACVATGVSVSVYTAARGPGHFPNGVERGFNAFAFFTIQSNLIAGVTTLLLAINPDRTSLVFRTFRMIGLVTITVTGIVFHVAIGKFLDLDGIDQFGNQLVHTVVPVLTVVGWLMFGPRGLTSARIAWLSVLYPVCWLAFTLIRGAVIHWYPYHFIDVDTLGYAKTLLNTLWVSILLLGLAAGATALDTFLTRTRNLA